MKEFCQILNMAFRFCSTLIVTVASLEASSSQRMTTHGTTTSIAHDPILTRIRFVDTSGTSGNHQNRLQIEFQSRPHFLVGDDPFLFVGAFVPPWHWGDEHFTEEVSENLIRTAKTNGINVLHLLVPPIERELGIFDESEMQKLDRFLHCAARCGVYVMISFIHAYGIVLHEEDPYYHPRGIEGLIKEAWLREAFENRMRFLVTHQNVITGKEYREDPTIMSWILVDEPVSAPWNYPQGPPDVTARQLNEWLEHMAGYVKNLDANHLVTVNTTAAIDQIDEWPEAFAAPSLDFIEPEDADMRILRYFDMDPYEYPLRLLSLGKPLVIMLSFTSGVWNQESICNDYIWQAATLRKAMHKYFDIGTGGVIVFSWGSALYPFVPSFDECYNYNASNAPICQMFQEVAAELGSLGSPSAPLQFVRIQTPTSVGRSIGEMPTFFSLEQNYPNPFTSETEIRFALTKSSRTLLYIYNTFGRQIRTLTDTEYSPGHYGLTWDGKDSAGNEVAGGVYLYKLEVDGVSQVKKMALLR